MSDITVNAKVVSDLEVNTSRAKSEIQATTDTLVSKVSKAVSDLNSARSSAPPIWNDATTWENSKEAAEQYLKELERLRGVEVENANNTKKFGDEYNKKAQELNKLYSEVNTLESKFNAAMAVYKDNKHPYVRSLVTEIDKLDDKIVMTLADVNTLRKLMGRAGVKMGDEAPQVVTSTIVGHQPITVDNPFAELGKNTQEVESSTKRITNAQNKMMSGFAKLKRGMDGLVSGADRLVNLFVRMGKSILTCARNMFTLGKASKRVGEGFGGKNLLKSILKYGLGISSIFVLFNKLRNSVQTGYANLEKYSSKVKAPIDEFKGALATLRNATAVAFEPLISLVVPILTKVAQAATQAFNAISMLFGALTGRGTAFQAKAMDKLADSTKGAGKAAKEALASYDELNVIQQDNGGGAGGADVGSMFEEVPIDSKMKELADKIKKIAQALFAPIKKAWDKVGPEVIKSFKNMVGKLKKLGSSIGRDFMIVWQQEATVEIFESVLRSVRNIFDTVGILADKIREAWDYNDNGLHILENIRDIIGIVVRGFETITEKTKEWASKLNLIPLFTRLKTWLESLKKPIQFIVDVVTDFYENVILKFATFVLEEGLPDLLGVFEDFNNKVDWESLRTSLNKLWESLEPFMEKAFEGIVLVIQDLADAFADWVNSGGFDEFVDKLTTWMDNVSAEDIKNFLENLAKALITLKLAVLGYKGLKGAISVISTLGTALSGLKTLGGGAINLAKGLGESLAATSVGQTIATALTTDMATVIGAGTFAEIGTMVAAGIVGAIVAAIGGYKLGTIIEGWMEDAEIDMASLYEKGMENQNEALKEQVSQQVAEATDLWNSGLRDIGAQLDWRGLFQAQDTNGGEDWAQWIEEMNLYLGEIGDTLDANNAKFTDRTAVEGYLDSIGELDSQAGKYIMAMQEEYDQLDLNARAYLEQQYGIAIVADGYSDAEIAAARAYVATDEYRQAVEQATSASYMEEQRINAVTRAQEEYDAGITQTARDIDGYYTKIYDLGDGLEYTARFTDNLAQSQLEQAAFAAQANGASADMVATMLGATPTIDDMAESVEESANDYQLLVDAMAGTSLSTSEFSSYMQILSETDLPAVSEGITNFSDSITSLNESIPTFENNCRTAFETLVEQIGNASTAFTEAFDTVDERLPLVEESFTTTFDNIKTAINELKTWFETDILPLFEQSYWDNALQGIPVAFDEMSKLACNNMVTNFNTMLEQLSSISMTSSDGNGGSSTASMFTFSGVPIPGLAKGAVLPANKPFMAMLGDQRNGTNIEAPLETIKDAMAEVLASNGGGNNAPIVLQLNGRTIAQVVWDESEKRYKQTGSRY